MTQVEKLNEKLAVYRKDNHALVADKPDALELGESLTADVLDKWSKDFENVSDTGYLRFMEVLTTQDPTLALSRLVLSHNDALQTLASRKALINDAKVFNLSLRGLNDKGEYPGPRVNQASSGRCWLFATSE
jgi:bleomycin hydrolase